MKKVLLATSALMLVAGAAAAEVKVSGSARMGVIYSETTDAEFSSRVRINFDASGETDGGLTFGASVRNDQVGTGGTANGDSTVFISGAFGKLTMGDTGNAADSLVGQVSGVGYGPGKLDGAADVKFLDTITKTGVSYEYTSGAVTFMVGSGQATAANDYISAAVKYAGSNFTVALGYESDATDNATSLSASTTFGAATVKAKVADSTNRVDLGYALSVDYAMGATTVTAFYADTDSGDALDANIGLGAAYDLGGGAALKGGIGSINGETAADIGMTFSF